MQLQTSEMEENIPFEGFVASVSSRLDPYSLDARVEAFGVGIGLSQPEDVEDSLHPGEDQMCHLLHGLQVLNLSGTNAKLSGSEYRYSLHKY